MFENLKKRLRKAYLKDPVGFRRSFERNRDNALFIFCIACVMTLIILLGWWLRSFAYDVYVYEIKGERTEYRTSEENYRLKEPYVNEFKYLIVEGE